MFPLKPFFYLLFLSGITSTVISANGSMVINELMGVNNSTVTDDSGEFDDWIELFNTSDDSIDINGWYLSDRESSLKKFKIAGNVENSLVIAPKSFLIIWADDQKEQGPLHANFKLDSHGEHLFLTSPDGKTIIDSLTFNAQKGDVSFGRYPDGTENWGFHKSPTPFLKNSSLKKPLVDPPVFSLPAGFYSHSIIITISSKCEDIVVFYSLDGSDPSQDSSLEYSNPITLDHTTVLRARTFNSDSSSSEIVTQTYFVNEESSLPVISLVTNPSNLWDQDSGIYVTGKNASDEYPYYGANYHQEWEKIGHFEFLSAKDAKYLSKSVSLKISGGWSRALDKKSFMIEVDNKNGNGFINYPFFKDKNITYFRKLMLRADAYGGLHLKNELIYELNKRSGSTVSIQSYLPVNLFLNDEYWGVYNLMESKGKEFIQSNYGYDDVDIIDGGINAIAGSSDAYNSFIKYLNSINLFEKESYKEIDGQIDVLNCIDYWFYEIYTGKHDNGNIRFWKAKKPLAKWRWISYDMDSWNTDINNFKRWTENPIASGYDILGCLLQNPIFKINFINRFSDLLNTTFRPDTIKTVISEIQDQIQNAMPLEILRWKNIYQNNNLSTISDWQNRINGIVDFSKNRPELLYQQMAERFSLKTMYSITINSFDTSNGTVILNSLKIKPAAPWCGTYFSEIPITLKALPNKNFHFNSWTSENLPDSSLITFSLTKNIVITPQFNQSTEENIQFSSITAPSISNQAPNPPNQTHPLSSAIFSIYASNGSLIYKMAYANQYHLKPVIISNQKNAFAKTLLPGIYFYKVSSKFIRMQGIFNFSGKLIILK